MPRVVCVGHATFDSVYAIDRFPERAEKVSAHRHDESIGGMAANAACAIAKLGGQVAFWGPLGDDAVADRILAEFDQAGVDRAHAFRVAGVETSHSAIVVDRNGERLIVSLRGSALSAPPDRLDVLPPADAVLIDVRWQGGAVAIARAYRQAGVPVIVDGEMGNAALLRELAPLADHLVFSEPGFREWAGRDMDPVERGEALRGLVARGCRLAAVTCGERGVWYAHTGASGRIPAFAVDAIETLGAGDAFHGAFALAVADPAVLAADDGRTAHRHDAPAGPADARARAVMRFASAVAALKCTRRGGRAALPTRAQALALMERRAVPAGASGPAATADAVTTATSVQGSVPVQVY